MMKSDGTAKWDIEAHKPRAHASEEAWVHDDGLVAVLLEEVLGILC